jgi:predicted aminopeptidase
MASSARLVARLAYALRGAKRDKVNEIVIMAVTDCIREVARATRNAEKMNADMQNNANENANEEEQNNANANAMEEAQTKANSNSKQDAQNNITANTNDDLQIVAKANAREEAETAVGKRRKLQSLRLPEEMARKIWNGETETKPAWFDKFEASMLSSMGAASDRGVLRVRSPADRVAPPS